MINLKNLKSYLSNTLWIGLDRVVFMVVSFVLVVILARYLGPEAYGVYAYAISLTALFVVAGRIGLGGLVVREIVKWPEERASLMGTAFFITLAGMCAAYMLLITYAFLFEDTSSKEFVALIVAGMVLIFKPYTVIEFWFQAFVKAKFVSLANLIALLITVIVKLLIIGAGYGLIYLLLANVLQSLLITLLLVYFFKRFSGQKLSDWRFNLNRCKALLSRSWFIYLGSFFAIIYLKMDQVMIRWLLGVEAVGLYSVAAQLSEAWYFVPSAIVASVFPKLIELREENEALFNIRLQQLFDVLYGLALIVAVGITVLAPWLIGLFFGSAYSESSNVLIIHIWAAVFIFMRAAFSKWILIEDVLVFSLITQGLGALLNIILNLVLIPEYGVSGAAYATLLSYMTASFTSLLFFSRTRPIFFMMCNSLLFVSYFRRIRRSFE